MADTNNMQERFRNSPEEVERVGRAVGNYSVALFGVDNYGGQKSVELIGTGTLVALGEFRYILTATHVWRNGLDQYDAVGLSMEEDIAHCFDIRSDAIVVRDLSKGAALDEWGPDMALLRIPQEHIAAIEARHVFYRLDIPRKKYEGDHLQVRILVGTPGVLSKGEGQIQCVEINALYLQVDPQSQTHGVFDYFDFDMDTTLPGVVDDFRGVSGGGVWDVEVFPIGERGKFESSETLVGVAYYQLPQANSHVIVRCHGPKTIAALIAEK